MAATEKDDRTFNEERERQTVFYYDTGQLIERIKEVIRQASSQGMRQTQSLVLMEKLELQQGIIESLKFEIKRKKMKVSVFGATSSGKSMVINAIIGREYMACGMGHTTSCFIQIEGAQAKTVEDGSVDDYNHEPGHRRNYMSRPSSCYVIRRPYCMGCEPESAVFNNKIDMLQQLCVENPLELQDLCDATADHPLDEFHVVEVFLSDDDHTCPLLNLPLQILDCPGISSCRQIGDRVKTFCGDSDVHVLIVDSSIVMTTEEKEHFMKVKEKLPNPDIIIGFNKWDLSDRERNQERVKKQHMQSAYDLLHATGTVSSMAEVEERCFFISARETIDLQCGRAVDETESSRKRLDEFYRFMDKIEERASNAAKKEKLDINRQACHEIIDSCLGITKDITEWADLNKTKHSEEIIGLKKVAQLYNIKLGEFKIAIAKRRDEAHAAIRQDVSECIEDTSAKMKRASVTNAFDRDMHEHAEMIVHDWYARIIRGFLRASRAASEDYSYSALGEYKKHFREFPHEHPKTYTQALNDEILPQIDSHGVQQEAVADILHGIGDTGLWAFFATTHRRLADIEGNDGRNKVVRRLAAGAGVVTLRIRRWIKDSVYTRVIDRAEGRQADIGLDELKKSCELAIDDFCNSADAYYLSIAENSIKVQIREQLQDHRSKRDELEKMAGNLPETLRQESAEIKGNQSM